MKIGRITIEVISVLYISLMLYTAVSKLSDYNLSREEMAMMPLLTPIAHVVSWLLPFTEIAIALLVFIPITRIKGLYVATALMTWFTVYIIYMMTNYEHLPCSCGGLLQALSWKGHLVFNSIFIVLGLVAIFLYRTILQVDQGRTLPTRSSEI
ncbi:MauE/DoxX family redox-associated membrane protein [Chitinophaga sp. S165]|uniref:MauE/DoxX family redox-associated membrane protein n=1 Tax=Chitinophaga sp. S165 TaxID=2135462 RepID=UPI000D7184B0|nr:MauE/DoxX family redox-associated membrane protein [Chitinophaga sp. S165]PWV55547.1 methylamine utilization protein MauE [Chitinophaga sp. S165]